MDAEKEECRDMDHMQKHFYRDPTDPDVSEARGIAEAAKFSLKVWFFYILPAVVVLYAIHYFFRG